MTKTTDVATTTITPTVESLRELQTFEDAIALATQELNAEIVNSADLGDGFALLEDKAALVGKPMMFITWRFSIGDYGPFVSAHVMVEESKGKYGKYIINDGSTGIYAQLNDLAETKPGQKTLYSPNGLRRSDFKYVDSSGESKPATTFYIDTSPAKS